MTGNLSKLRSCFVTGTDTGVGKTMVAAALLHRLAQRGLRAAGMKPVAAGAEQRDGAWVNEDAERLAAAASVEVPRELLCPYPLPEAVAPHIAAESAGVRLELGRILRAYAALEQRADAVVVEGVGGWRVPLGEDFDSADLAAALRLPVVLVVGLRLGCLNHAALTAESVAARGLVLAGWVANTLDPRMPRIERNVQTLQRLLPAPCFGWLPWMDRPEPRRAAQLLGTDETASASGNTL